MPSEGEEGHQWPPGGPQDWAAAYDRYHDVTEAAERVIEALYAALRAGRPPSTRGLGASLGMARTTVNGVIQGLVEAGVLIRQVGRPVAFATGNPPPSYRAVWPPQPRPRPDPRPPQRLDAYGYPIGRPRRLPKPPPESA